MPSSIAARLESLGHRLLSASAPAANYVPTTRHGGLLLISGQICQDEGEAKFIGKLGENVSPDEGRKAAELSALNVIAHIDAAVDGDIERVERILRLGGFINSTPDFTAQPQILNGASDLMVDVFGERGRHARTTVSVASLPRGVAVEIDAIVAIRN
ncbi:RidA family protein [Stappia sp. GBMRC 2046]|uniref:RidA family protein n=1 Tax=Stappia sediminis TaxID=2692190 RepID=A0A7X3S7P1_9HYPH|nr:RidA family protein [Stappia sediminis]MXN64996.1 RidA family protein [Stappia sediminis]